VTAMSAKAANAYCASLGKEMDPVNWQSHGVQGFTPMESTFVFRCLAADDPANRRPNLRPTPNTVIEIQKQQ
jgi:hypothetical protein